MTVIEHPWPCLVVSCDRCGLTTWPVDHSKQAATDRAKEEFGFRFARDGKRYCADCTKKRRRKS